MVHSARNSGTQGAKRWFIFVRNNHLYNFIFTSNDDVESIVNMIKEYILNEKLDVSIDFDNNEEVSNILVINHAK